MSTIHTYDALQHPALVPGKGGGEGENGTSNFASGATPIYDNNNTRQQGGLTPRPSGDKQLTTLEPRPVPPKVSTDTFGISQAPSSPEPPKPSLPITANSPQSTATPQASPTIEDMQDSDEAPYSDSDTDELPNDFDQATAPSTNASSASKQLDDSYDDSPVEQRAGFATHEAFPNPPLRKGASLIKLRNQPTQTKESNPDQKHTVGQLSHQRSMVKIHKKEVSSVVPDTVTLKQADGNRRVDDADSGSISGSSMYRRAGLRSNTSDWAPSALPPIGAWAGISNLPDWTTIRKNEPTSKPIVNVQRDLDWSMKRLLNENVFEQLVNDQLGRHRFREFLAQTTGTENKLDMYFDLCQYAKQNNAIRQASEALHDVYLAQDSNSHVSVPEDMSDDFYDTLKKQFEVRPTLEPLQQHLLQSLYKTDFKLYVKSRLVEHNKVKLGSFNDDGEDTGLGDCFCLTNPRLRENPIVLVSPGFERVTGYPRQQIIGRNCRFLQGPSTAPDSVQRIRDSLNAGEPCTELLLNYRRDGTPFFCLLTIIPLRDASGTLVYFIGGQTNVNGQLASSKGLKFLLGGADPSITSNLPQVNGLEVSTSLARHIRRVAYQSEGRSGNGPAAGHAAAGHAAAGVPTIGNGSSNGSLKTRRKVAAGEYDPNSPMSAPPGMMIGAKPPGKSGNAMSRFLRGGSSKKERADMIEPMTQRLIGAEASMRKDPYSLEDQMSYFTALYSKVIIFKRTKREIIFATRECISFFDLPLDTWKDLYASPLVHADLLSIVQGQNKEETKMVQHALQNAVRKGEGISVKTGIKQVKTKKRFLGVASSTTDWVTDKDTLKYVTIHITPLRDRDNSSFAFVALFA